MTIVENPVQVEVVDPNLRRHQLVKKGAEEVGEGLPLTFMYHHLLLCGIKTICNLRLNFHRRKEHRH